jgi:3-methyladenine DNA glycosylase AlkD
LQKLLSQNVHPENSIHMKRYMKDQFEFFGINSVERKELTRKFFTAQGIPSKHDYKEVIRELWDLPQREFQYAALDILEHLVKKRIQVKIELLEYLIMTKSWWDTVDWMATRIVGVCFRQNPELITQTYSRWMEIDNIWLQRVCILFQLKYKEKTDVKLLFSTIQELSGSEEFFIQKAIGWALREQLKIDPAVVQKFVDENELAPLSRREALKVLKRY